MNNEDKNLDRVLESWRCPVERDPQLGARVWQRIAEREESRWFGAGWMDALGVRPALTAALAAGLMVAAVAGGITAAEVRVQSMREYAAGPDLEQVYFESINPVAMARSHRHP
jgi:hypothetical protein